MADDRYDVIIIGTSAGGGTLAHRLAAAGGGNTKFYGAALFRLRPEDFGKLRHHGGVSPAWPISDGDLEPY